MRHKALSALCLFCALLKKVLEKFVGIEVFHLICNRLGG